MDECSRHSADDSPHLIGGLFRRKVQETGKTTHRISGHPRKWKSAVGSGCSVIVKRWSATGGGFALPMSLSFNV